MNMIELKLKKGEGLICDECLGLIKGNDENPKPFFLSGKVLIRMRCEDCERSS